MRIRWWHWVELYARAIIWAGALLFSVLTVIGTIPILPENLSIRLLIFLYLFMLAMVIAWWFDMVKMYPPRRR